MDFEEKKKFGINSIPSVLLLKHCLWIIHFC